MSQTISITQGLAELKLLDKRLNKALSSVKLVCVKNKTRPLNTEEFTAKAKAEYQSYQDLMKRRLSIKCAIVTSNATTNVKVGSWEGTVAEAIEYKTSILYKKHLLDAMKEQLLQARTEFDSAQENINRRLDVLLQSELGKDVKTNPETITALTTTFRETNKVELIDPLDLAKKIQELEEEIDGFETNVDWVLSETNGKTMISF